MIESPMASSNDVPMIMSPSKEEEVVEQAPEEPKCFSVVQTKKKFWSPLLAPTCRLCPSMDIVILGMQSNSSSTTPSSSEPTTAASLWLHRTVSWQRLATLTNFNGKDTEEGVTHVAWSPDGRNFALALPSGDVALYHVEAMVSSLSSMSAELNTNGLLCVIPVAKEGIVGLNWAHVGRNHPSWHLTDAEEEETISWSYRSRYVDRAAQLLPPSDHYNLLQSQDHQGNHSSTALPTCKTPLSLLCVSTKGKGLHLFLHGRYRLLTLPMMAQRNVDVVCSSDLRNILVHQEKSMNLSLFSIPSLPKYRYQLQTISSLYCSISSHLDALKEHATEIQASWKVSIKPLDTKLDGLVRLLRDYGVKQDVRSVLVQYILVGHTSVSSDLSNAIDQFFTGVQMNDQLVTRMERSLQSAIANVETTARSFLLGPARALAFHADELLGLARSAPNLLLEECSKNAHDSCAILLTTAEYTLMQLVEARFRLRDFVAWLRCTGSEIKARGTAANSAQRENAKKRRVPQANVERILKYLQNEAYQSTSITETILGIPVTELLSVGHKFVHARPASPTTVADKELGTASMERKTPTVLHATKVTEDCFNEAFESPRSFLSRSVYRTDLFLPVERKTEFLPVAIHTRLGRDAPFQDDDYEETGDEEEGFFSPNVAGGKSLPGIPHCYSRQWSVIAKTGSTTESRGNYIIKLYLIPHDWTDPNDEIEDEDALAYGIGSEDQSQECGVPFYLTTEIILPEGHRVLDVAFYGDDGRSNLSSGLDSGTGRERRQALGILLGNALASGSSEETIELWMLSYDNLTFQVIPAKKDSKQVFLDDGVVDGQFQVHAHPLKSQEEYSDEEDVVFAKTRVIGFFDSSSTHSTTARLMLCGPRGIGGVSITTQGMTTLDLFDLEEDEEPDDDEEEGSEDQSMED